MINLTWSIQYDLSGVNNMQIRQANNEDTKAVYGLICELENTRFPEAEFNTLFHHNLQQEAIGYFVATLDDQVVGFASVHINNLLHHCAKVAEIQELIVAPAQRNQQIGEALLQALRGWSELQGALQLEVTCNNLRADAQRFYQRHGFVATHQKLVAK